MFAIFQSTGSKPEEKDLMNILHNEVDNYVRILSGCEVRHVKPWGLMNIKCLQVFFCLICSIIDIA